MKSATTLTIGCIVFLALASSARAEPPAQQQEAVYVWDFATRQRERTDLTEKLTHEFEAALIENGPFVVLERRDIDRLLAQRDNERAIVDIMDASPVTRKRLSARHADMVVFGEVFDDVDSGEITITITLQEFDGTKREKKPIRFSRGKAADAASRQTAMANLVRALAGTPAPVHRVEAEGFLFELGSCHRAQDGVACTLRITNRDRDREFGIYTTFKDVRSRIHDNTNRESRASRATLAGKHARFGYVYNLLLAGQPADALLLFEEISPHATKISRLEIAFGVARRKPSFRVQLRDIPIQ